MVLKKLLHAPLGKIMLKFSMSCHNKVLVNCAVQVILTGVGGGPCHSGAQAKERLPS